MLRIRIDHHLSFDTPLKLIVKSPTPVPEEKQVFGKGTITINNLTFTSGEKMDCTIPVGHLGVLTVEWVDELGNPCKVDGETSWASTDDTIVEVQVAAGNSLIANVHSAAIGTCQVQATADADMGAGIRAVTFTFDFTVIAGEAVGGKGSFTDSGPGDFSPGGGAAAKPAKK